MQFCVKVHSNVNSVFYDEKERVQSWFYSIKTSGPGPGGQKKVPDPGRDTASGLGAVTARVFRVLIVPA